MWPGGKSAMAVEGAIDRFAAVAFDPDSWVDALHAMAEATGSARGQLIGLGGPHAVPFNWVTGFPQDALREFVAIDGGNPAINPRVAADVAHPHAEILFETHYDAATACLKSDVYAEFSDRHDIPYGCQTRLLGDNDNMVGLAVLRTRADGRTREADRAAFARIVPHVRAAVRLQLALEGEGARIIAGTLEAMSAAAFLCDEQGRVVDRTPAADALLRDGRLRLSGRAIASPVDGETARLIHAIRAAAGPADGYPPLPARIILRGYPGAPPLWAEVSRLPRHRMALGRGACALVIVRGHALDRVRLLGELRRSYDLSAAEADVALRLAGAENREEIAAARHVSLETVRAQIKALFAKMGVNREAELVALLAPMLRG